MELCLYSKEMKRKSNSENVHECPYQLPTDLKFIGFKKFMVFPMLIYPMTREEAHQCLMNFVDSAADAINALH